MLDGNRTFGCRVANPSKQAQTNASKGDKRIKRRKRKRKYKGMEWGWYAVTGSTPALDSSLDKAICGYVSDLEPEMAGGLAYSTALSRAEFESGEDVSISGPASWSLHSA